MSKKKIYSGGKKERNRQAVKKYQQTEKSKMRRKKPHAKITTLKAVKKYAETEKGKIIRKRANKKWNKDKGKEYALKHKYGITLEQHKQMYAEQDGCCAICGILVQYSKIHTDHDHQTNKIRGLLCHGCNIALGMVKEDIVVLEKMKQYLM